MDGCIIRKNFSAKDLCTLSCMQLKWFSCHPETRPKPNSNVLMGESFQHKVAKTTDGLIGQEMRGEYETDALRIYFSNDIVCNDYIMEVKSVDKTREVADWYFKSSVVQCAVYKSLLMMGNGWLTTSTFFVDMGNPRINECVNTNIDYYLLFGDEKYKVNVTNPKDIVGFICTKAKASLDWTEAKNFDNFYKHKEYDMLQNWFNVERIN